MAERNKIKSDHKDIVLEPLAVNSETFGEYLRRERELRQITLHEISEGTKIAIYMLKAMESDQWDKLPAEIFIKGFVKSYAEYLGLVPEDVLLRYEQAKAEGSLGKGVEPTNAIPKRIVSTRHRSSSKSSKGLWIFLLLALVAAAAAGYYWFYMK